MSPKKIEAGTPADRASALSAALANIGDKTEDLANRLLVALSDLSTDEIKQLGDVWRRISPGRKRAVLSRLRELAEDNVQYNFHAVLRHVLSDADAQVRREAIEGLWEDEEPSLVRPLLSLFQNDKSPEVRAAAAVALGRFSLLAECDKIEDAYINRLSQPLLGVIDNPAEPLPVRRRALESLAPLSLPEVTRAIWAAYRQEEPEMKASAIRGMGLNCDPLWLPSVMQELGSDNPEIRYEATIAAGSLGEVEAAPALIELLDDPDREVRLAAVLALGQVGGAEAKRALRHILRGKDQPMRDAATTALTNIEVFEEPFSAQLPE